MPRRSPSPTPEQLAMIAELPVARASEVLGVARQVIRRWRNDHGLPAAPYGRPPYPRPECLTDDLLQHSNAELARRYGVSNTTIRRLRAAQRQVAGE